MTVADEVVAWQVIQDEQLAARSDPYYTSQDRLDHIAYALPGDVEGVRGRGFCGPFGMSCSGEWTWPTAPSTGTIIYVHGGNSNGSSRAYRQFAAQLCVAASADVLALDYRRPPEALYDTPMRDLLSAIDFLQLNGLTNLTIACDSFGATPALAAAIYRRMRKTQNVLGIYMNCPKANYAGTPLLTLPSKRADRCPATKAGWGYFSRVPCDTWRAAPQLADLRNLPPVMIHATTAHGFITMQRDLRDRLLAAGNDCEYREWDLVPHIWPYWGNAFTYTAEAMTEAGAWLQERMQ